MTETEWQNNLVELAHIYGWRVAHFGAARTAKGYRTPVRYDGAGFPDLVLAHPDRGVIYVEVKSDSGRMRPEQVEWATVLVAAGERHYVWRPSDLNDAAAVLAGV